MSKDLIRLDKVTKYYKTEYGVSEGMNRISLELNLNEFVAITGESGSGKTTLLNVLSGLDSYEDGEYYIDGVETSHYTIKDWEEFRSKYVGFIFQNYNVIDSYTVLENILIALEAQGYNRVDANAKARELIEKVGLTSHLNQKTTKLSGGQKQRVVIARALAKNAPIILADEPTGNLDNENSIEIMKLLKEISEDKLVILVTHDFEMAKPFVTRVIELDDGRLVKNKELVKSAVNKESKPIIHGNENNIYSKTTKIALRNLKSTPKRTMFQTFLFILVLLVAITSLTIITKDLDYSSETIGNTGIIYKKDQSNFNSSDINKIKDVKEKDILISPNYFDYTHGEISKNDKIYFANFKDAAILYESDIKGKLPKNDNEIIYSYSFGNRDDDGIFKQKINDRIIFNGKTYIITGLIYSEESLNNPIIYLNSSTLYDENYKLTSEFQDILPFKPDLNGFLVRAASQKKLNNFIKSSLDNKSSIKDFLISNERIFEDYSNNDTIFLTKVGMYLGYTFILLVIFLLIYQTQKNIFNNRRKDFAVYRSIGINEKEVKYILILEQLFMSIIAIIISNLFVILLRLTSVRINLLFSFVGFFDYLLTALIFSVFSIYLGNKNNKLIFKKTVIESLKEGV